MGYEKPDKSEPRQIESDVNNGVSSPGEDAKKRKREDDKDTSDRKTRDKNNPSPKRKDQDSKPR